MEYNPSSHTLLENFIYPEKTWMNMAIKNLDIFAIITISCFFLIGLAGAANPISTINPGDMVFIGEQGLDISAAMGGDTQIGWWASGAAVSTSSPDKTITVTSPGSFSVSSSEFSGYTGSWYHLSSPTKANGVAFSVVDPQLELRVEDTTVNVDVTNKWVPTGDDIRFGIDTNLAQMTQRTGVSYVPITIKVQSPSGGVFTALVNSAGTATPITDIQVKSSSYYTDSLWDTGVRSTYPAGTYTIWAECNVNSMKDNYGQTGKTVSPQVSLLLQDQNPLIGNKGYVTNPTTSVPTAAITNVPTTQMTVKTTSPTPAPTSAPVTTITTVSLTTPIETLPAVSSSATTSVPTKTPGFEGALAVLAAIVGLASYHKRK
jgi:hypothetical protein